MRNVLTQPNIRVDRQLGLPAECLAQCRIVQMVVLLRVAGNLAGAQPGDGSRRTPKGNATISIALRQADWFDERPPGPDKDSR